MFFISLISFNRLTSELADAERYQEAYYSLSDEVGSLLARNALAEDEAQRLSKFNAEILGHNNPAQRIMYVERIRSELAGTKHVCVHHATCLNKLTPFLKQLLQSKREHENIALQKEDLERELGMYKSVFVHPDHKPRTNITRIHRIPLNQVTANGSSEDKDPVQDAEDHTISSISFSLTPHLPNLSDESEETLFKQVLEDMHTDMTLDEIM
jgi:hypothetical protein